MPTYDITLPISESLNVWPGDAPVSIIEHHSVDAGDHSTVSRLTLSAHTGTHVDAVRHFVPGGPGVDAIDLDTLIGPALVISVAGEDAISADTLGGLPIPPSTERLLLRTTNSERRKHGERGFFEDYVAVSEDGARWLVERGIRLVGIDCLSVAPYADTGPTHRILLGNGVVVLEGLDLSQVSPGAYQLVCLPLRIAGCDGAPARAVLIGPDARPT